MKISAFPVTVQVVNQYDVVIFERLCKNNESLKNLMKSFKTQYKINPNHMIFFVCNSKVNDAIQKIRDD